MMTSVYELRRQGGGLGLAAICDGIGESEAIFVEVQDGGSS